MKEYKVICNKCKKVLESNYVESSFVTIDFVTNHILNCSGLFTCMVKGEE